VDHFEYRDDELHAEEVAVADLARRHGTPLYVYSRATLTRHYRAFGEALKGHPHLICYAVKANSNLAVLQVLAKLGSGFDIVSGGELNRALKAGADPDKIVFSGVGKSAAEIKQALLADIHCFNVESESELARLNDIAVSQKRRARIALRVNPDVDPKTHPYIATGLKNNKFGVAIGEAEALYAAAAKMPGLNVSGIGCHIGSQLMDVSPHLDALDRLLALVDRLAAGGIRLEHLDIGGGLGVRYKDETPPQPADLVRAVLARLGSRPLKLMLEPGRAIAGNAGILVTRVEYLKPTAEKNFLVVDAAMNDLIRPALYDAWMDVVPVKKSDGATQVYDIVGPVCESGDWLARERALAAAPGDLLAVRTAGAYGYSMASNYNTRPRAAEVMVDGKQSHLIRARESFDDLIRGETLLAE